MSKNDHGYASYRRYLLWLTAIFTFEWIALAIHPVDRTDWIAENVLVAFFVIAIAFSYRQRVFSRPTYTMILLFLSLPEVGAHYTYSAVPYDAWFEQLTGRSLNALMGWKRNNFDRLVHFSYGLLMAYPIRSVYLRVADVRGFWSYFLPMTFIMSTSMMYELIEWGASTLFGGVISLHYVGSQGDPWDAQKDMALATLGAFITICCLAVINGICKRNFVKVWLESLRVKHKAPL
jgi:putative membrane protein